MAKDYDLFFTCSLMENIARIQHLKRGDVAKHLGVKTIAHIYNHADVLHCEDLNDVSMEFIELNNIPTGTYDNIASCHYTVPTSWIMGDVYTRLITLVHAESGKTLAEDIFDIFTSWFMDELCNLNTDLYYQWPEYHYQCYLAGKILD